ncbi:MAG: hypothetical protein KDK96_10830 [Chlamydiia bacterium]|nr:hypothetical protein [Chlamydiia bacterium]
MFEQCGFPCEQGVLPMATQKFWSQKLFEKRDIVKISYEGIAKKYQTTTRSAKNYIKRDINAGLILRCRNQYLHPIFQKICDGKNTYLLTQKGKEVLGKDPQYPNSGSSQSDRQDQLQNLRVIYRRLMTASKENHFSQIPSWWLKDIPLLRKTIQLLFKKIKKGYRVSNPYGWVSKTLKDRGVGYRVKIVNEVLEYLQRPQHGFSPAIDNTYERLGKMVKVGLDISPSSLLKLLRKGFSHLGQALHSYERLQLYTLKVKSPTAFLNYLVSLKDPFSVFFSSQSCLKQIERVKSLLQKKRGKIVFLPQKTSFCPESFQEEKLHVQFLVHKHLPERSVLKVFQNLKGTWKETVLKALQPTFLEEAKTIINAI